jgi:uncharacterized protein (DUF433 family)
LGAGEIAIVEATKGSAPRAQSCRAPAKSSINVTNPQAAAAFPPRPYLAPQAAKSSAAAQEKLRPCGRFAAKREGEQDASRKADILLDMRAVAYNRVMSTAHIEIRSNRSGQARAFIAETRIRVQDIYALSELQGLTPDQIVRSLPHLTLGQVHAALAYYFDHRDEILNEVREEQALASKFREMLGPGPLETKLKVTDAARDPISS